MKNYIKQAYFWVKLKLTKMSNKNRAVINLKRHQTAVNLIFKTLQQCFQDEDIKDIFKQTSISGEYLEFTVAGFPFCIVANYHGVQSVFDLGIVRNTFSNSTRTIQDIPELTFISTNGEYAWYNPNTTSMDRLEPFLTAYLDKFLATVEAYIIKQTKSE